MSAHVDFLSVLDEPRHLEQVNLCAPKAKLDLTPGVIDEENDFATNVEADTHAAKVKRLRRKVRPVRFRSEFPFDRRHGFAQDVDVYCGLKDTPAF